MACLRSHVQDLWWALNFINLFLWVEDWIGDMVHLNALGQNYLILGNLKIINDLLEKRSKNYSDRVRSPLILDLWALYAICREYEGFSLTSWSRMESHYNFALLPYGSGWRDRRRAFQNVFHQNKVNEYLPAQLRGVRAFIRNVLESPDEFTEWIYLWGLS